MVKESPDPALTDPEDAQHAPPEWPEAQQKLADDMGLSLLLVEGVQPPALLVSNNNSICEAIQSSADHGQLCNPFCGDAHRRTVQTGDETYRCHAGIYCVTAPVRLGPKSDLAVIGGRAFLSLTDYQGTVERFRSGDLKDLFGPDTFGNVIFSTSGELSDLRSRFNKMMSVYNAAISASIPLAGRDESLAVQSEVPELKKEIEDLKKRVETQAQFPRSLQYFIDQITSADPDQTYYAILMNCKELLQAERASLLAFDEGTNLLTIRAAVGLPEEISEISTMRLGEGISGKTMEAGLPRVVTDIETSGITPAPRERAYKTKSFISFPITIGGRRVGVLNVTDKSGGATYDEVDLSLLDIIGPQVALTLERAEWQGKALQFQLMSITDPLTGLPNRRYLEERLAEEVSRSKRYEHPLSFLMIDIDDFKHYNDRNGHQAGDLALQMAAHGLKSTLRSADVASRYGGEEFCVVLPQTSRHEAAIIAERMRERIEQTRFTHAAAQPLGAVTISIGVSTLSPSVNTGEQIIWAADRALYEAKREGKNQIAFFQDPQQKAPTTDD